MFKISYLDTFIIVLMFALLPIDMINGFLLTNNVNLPISLGQLHKLAILFFLFIRFLFYPQQLLIAVGTSFLLLIPTIYQLTIGFSEPFLFADIIKVSKYLTPLYAFLFFARYIKQAGKKEYILLLKFIKFSYVVLAGNILIKLLGFGYPMYEFGDIGSKGFFYAGNEVSALLIVISSILGIHIWKNFHWSRYLLFTLFTLFVGFTIGSKTGVLGLIIMFTLVPLKPLSFVVNIKKMISFGTAVLILIPIALYSMWRAIQETDLMIRITYFSQKFDMLTFLLSNRNVFLQDAWRAYRLKYEGIEKIIGVGQAKFEWLTNDRTVEIDVIDIFFAYGIIGVSLLILLLGILIAQASKFSRNGDHPFANFDLLMCILLIAISSTAGHVFSSGMAAIFIGLLFALMYFKKEQLVV